ncbi:hypothetical protein [Enterovibrio calviensis]|uniref:hypothetical protein n=1 Tax=Enterovibrio calviensis TaxID=91359 RepID=UPI0004833533|nr:hypothetical protein [Enterovibrio calviensis]
MANIEFNKKSIVNGGKIFKSIHIISLVLILSACSSGTVTRSFDEITSDFDNEGMFTQIFGWPYQNKLLSISGMVTAYEIGMTCNTSPWRGVFTMFCYDMAAEKSYVSALNFNGYDETDKDKTLNDLRLLKSKIDLYQSMALQTSLLSIKLAGCEFEKKKNEQEITKLSSDSSNDADAQKRIVELQANNASLNCEPINQEVLAANTKLDELLLEIQKLKVANGVVSYTWSADSSVGGNVNATDAASVSGSAGKAISGYALVQGIRVKTIVIGQDFEKMYGKVRSNWWPSTQLKMPTALVQARNIVYGSSEDFSAIIKAAADVSKLKGVKIDKTLQAEFNATINRALSNSGALNLVNIQRKPLDCNYGDAGESSGTNSGSAPCEFQAVDSHSTNSNNSKMDLSKNYGFLTTYAVFTSVEDLIDSAPDGMFNSKAKEEDTK